MASTADSPLSSDVAGDPDSPIRVVVTPSQSAYFAGETLSVTITFTNTRIRSPSEGATLAEVPSSSKLVPSRSASKTHKRASHSVSSAPIAKPPTSPAGLYRPRTPTTAAVDSRPGSPSANVPVSLGLASDGTPMRRRGLVGKKIGSTTSVPDLVEQRRKKMLTKSLSLTIGAEEGGFEGEDGKIVKSASYTQRSFTADSYLPPTSPRVSSPLARSETLPLPSKHPHARKQSVMDGSTFPYPSTPPFVNGNELVTSPISPTSATSTISTANTLPSVASPVSGPATPSASSSSFSLALDPIAEVSPTVPAYPYLASSVPASASALGPALSSPSINVEAPSPPASTTRQPLPPPSSSNKQSPQPPSSKPTSSRQINRPPNIGLGRPNTRMFLDLNKSNAELILYSYAQLKGTVTLTPLPSNNVSSSSSAKSLTSPRAPSQSPSLPYPSSPSAPHLAQAALPLSAAQIEAQKVQTLAALRHALIKGSATAVGGGSMDITSRTHSRTPSTSGAASLGGGIGSGSWGSLSAGPVSAYGPLSSKSTLQTINSGSTDTPNSPSVRRPHSRSSSFSSGLLSIFGSPFGFGGSGPVSAPVTHPNNLAASISAPDVVTPGAGGTGSYSQQPHRPTRNRAASAGLVPTSGWPSSTSSPSLNNHSVPATAGLEPSSFGSFPSSPAPGYSSGSKLGLGLGRPLGLAGLGSLSTEEVDPELPLPTFEAQSAMLAVDVSLEPGESRSYEYSILLPSNLPPTFRGRTFRFAYELVVGICRSGSGNHFSVPGKGGGGGPGGSMSKVMKVPIRMYTNVVVGRSPTPYDLLWPVTKRRSTAVLGHRRGGRMPSLKGAAEKDDPYAGKVVEITRGSVEKDSKAKQGVLITVSDSSSSLSAESSTPTSGSGSLTELKEYAKRLVAELSEFELPDKKTATEVALRSNSKTILECEAVEVEAESISSEGSVISPSPSISASSSLTSDGRGAGIQPKHGLSPLLEEDASSSGGGGAGSGEGAEEGRKVNGHGHGNGNGNAVPMHMGHATHSRTRAPTATSAAELAFKEKERIARLRQREESDEPMPVGGCGEAVEILTRNPKKVSYDVNKDGVKVAVLTFIKSAFRLGETIHGVVELNERIGRARVVQLSAHLETHESLPYPISTTPNTPSAVRQLKRVHVEHHSSFVLSTLRTTFALDIPSDASPAFQIKVGDDTEHLLGSTQPKPTRFEGGLEWKVRLCLLVAVAKESSDSGTEGVRFKSLVRDGARGEWGSAWRAPADAAPCEKPVVPSSASSPLSPSQVPRVQQQQQGVVRSWTSYLAASLLGTGEEEGGNRYHDGDEYPGDDEEDEDDGDMDDGRTRTRDDYPFPRAKSKSTMYDGIKPNRAGGVGVGVNFGGGREARWRSVKLETVECEVPVRVWPGNTAFRPVDVVFDV
ncbi:hypothetical protein GYMLUDRAFT_70155 [Collybiopsis luxurians FD-317 M1]|nr:hypothetical protein GYMLUDRAFT_70155 [Collybiopsis luxurians FD-317 M1]